MGYVMSTIFLLNSSKFAPDTFVLWAFKRICHGRHVYYNKNRAVKGLNSIEIS